MQQRHRWYDVEIWTLASHCVGEIVCHSHEGVFFCRFSSPEVCIYQVLPAPLLLPLNLAGFLQSICLRHTQTRAHTHKYSTFTYKIPAVPLRPSPRRNDRVICHAPFISTCHRLVSLRPLFLLIVFLWPPPRCCSFSHTYQTLAAFQREQDETLRKLWLAESEKIWN